jgi:uncharacterized protein YjiS (DUF1127 family)
MSTTYGETGLGRAAASTQRSPSFFKKYWDAFQERRQRQRVRTALCDLSDWELKDIGTTRGEIDYVASHRGGDPRGIRSAGRMSISGSGGRSELDTARCFVAQMPTSGMGPGCVKTRRRAIAIEEVIRLKPF